MADLYKIEKLTEEQLLLGLRGRKKDTEFYDKIVNTWNKMKKNEAITIPRTESSLCNLRKFLSTITQDYKVVPVCSSGMKADYKNYTGTRIIRVK